MEFGNYAAYFNGLNPTRRNLLSFSNLGVNTFTGPVTIKNAVEIQGLDGSRYKALGPATNPSPSITAPFSFITTTASFDQSIAVIGTTNALSLNNSIANSSVSNAVTSDSGAVLWSVAGTTNGRLTYTGDLSGFAGTLKVKSSATGAVVIDTNTFGGTFEVESAAPCRSATTPQGIAGPTTCSTTAIDHLQPLRRQHTYTGAISGTGTSPNKAAARSPWPARTPIPATTVTAGRLNLTGSLAGDVNVTGGAISGTGDRRQTDHERRHRDHPGRRSGHHQPHRRWRGVLFPDLAGFRQPRSPPPSMTCSPTAPAVSNIRRISRVLSAARSTTTLLPKSSPSPPTNRKVSSGMALTGDWDQTEPNWNSAADAFYDWDSVTFNNPAASAVVTLTGILRPASVAVTNSAGNDYTFSGERIDRRG
jgi:hypothetical protein